MRGGAGGRQTRNGVLAQTSHFRGDGDVLSVRQLVDVVAIVVVVVGRCVGEALKMLSVKMGIMGIDAGRIVGLVALGAGVCKLALEWMAEVVESGDIG